MDFKAVNDLLISALSSNVELIINENSYFQEFKEYKQKEMESFLADKIFKDSDIKEFYKDFLKL